MPPHHLLWSPAAGSQRLQLLLLLHRHPLRQLLGRPRQLSIASVQHPHHLIASVQIPQRHHLSTSQHPQQAHHGSNSEQPDSDAATARRRKFLGILSGSLVVTMFATFYLWKERRLRFLESQAVEGRVGPDTSVGSSGDQQLQQQQVVGGDFRLQDQSGRYVTRQEVAAAGNSRWLLMYFGFCHCPDICPEQMEKIVEVSDRLQLAKNPRPVTPVFVSIDPERDTPALVKEYIADFSNKFVGLTGTKAEVDAVAKKYRIYYSKGPVDQDGDYIVDHAIIMYLVDPEGRVVDYYGQTKSAKEIAACIYKVIGSHM